MPAYLQRKGNTMATYIALNKFTTKGSDAVKDTVKRSEQFTQLAKRLNVDFKNIFWSAGPYDSIVILEAQSDADVMAFGVAIKQAGFITSEMIRVYNKSEMNDIIGAMKV
jgi:uncharacterized protein with GYD domain